jgi:hypothetical protein
MFVTTIQDQVDLTVRCNGFTKCYIVPVNQDCVIRQIQPHSAEIQAETAEIHHAVSGVELEILTQMRQGPNAVGVKEQKKRSNIVPGKSISLADFQAPAVPEVLARNDDATDSDRSCDSSSVDDASDSKIDDKDVPILSIYPLVQPVYI